MSGASRIPSRNIPQLSTDAGIKVLMVIASPADQVRLNLLKQEALRLQAELERKNPRWRFTFQKLSYRYSNNLEEKN